METFSLTTRVVAPPEHQFLARVSLRASAASRRAARISSGVSLGYAWRTIFSSAPSANLRAISSTGILVPRITRSPDPEDPQVYAGLGVGIWDVLKDGDIFRLVITVVSCTTAQGRLMGMLS